MKIQYAILINTLAEGCVPSVREGDAPAVFATEREAQCEIADNLLARLQEFLDGEREFEDAMTVEEFIVKVRLLPDGSLTDEFGKRMF